MPAEDSASAGPIDPSVSTSTTSRSKLVIWAHLGALHPVGDLAHRGEDRVDRDRSYRIVALVLLGGPVADALLDGQLHLQRGAVREGDDVEVLVHDLHPAGRRQGGGRDGAGARHREFQGEWLRIVHPHHQTLDVEDDVDHVLLHAGNRRELVIDAIDPQRRYGCSGYAGEQCPPQGVPERVTEARLQRFDQETCPELADHFGFDLWTLDYEGLHGLFLSVSVCVSRW